MRKLPYLILAIVGIASAAIITIQLDGSTLGRPWGSFRPLNDGGMFFSVCYNVKQTDGGTGLQFQDCVACEPGGWNNAPSVCPGVWKAANGGL